MGNRDRGYGVLYKEMSYNTIKTTYHNMYEASELIKICATPDPPQVGVGEMPHFVGKGVNLPGLPFRAG